MTHVSDVVKFGLMSTSWRSFAKRPMPVTVQAVLMTTARILRSGVNGNRSRSDLKQRREE